MNDGKTLEPFRDVQTWHLSVDGDSSSLSVTFEVSSRERLMNKQAYCYIDLLGARFDAAARLLREEFLKSA